MLEGRIIANRFAVEEAIGTGGMGAVYRARDMETGGAVAMKVMMGAGWEERLLTEARVLSELRHPRIVRYVAHGTTDEGAPFLAMQWLEGEDLGHRLDAGGGLSATESVRIAMYVAEALAVGHSRGVLHRDVKPSNVFLREGEVDKTLLIDFGLARSTVGGRRLTQTGSVLGTPEYMAPEQARGERDIDARVDVYALGCVLFECLTGRTPFHADHAIAVLGKILLETAPRLRTVRPELPDDLEELLVRMLSKDRSERPRDGAEVLSALHALAPMQVSDARPLSVPPASITHGEQRLMSVIIARPKAWPEESMLASLRMALTGPGDALQMLADGSILIALPGYGAAPDHAGRAARAALELRRALGGGTVVLATGRGLLSHGWPAGEALDRAASLLGDLEAARMIIDAPVAEKLTAGLLGARFVVREQGPFHAIYAEEAPVIAKRTVLGRATPFVGRERVMRDLAAMIEGSLRDEAARTVVLTASPGVGKTRLLHELVQSLGAAHPDLAVWTAHGEAVHAGSPLSLIGPLVRSLAAQAEGDDDAVRLRARVARTVAPQEAERVATFLGEIAGVRPLDEESVQLRAARADAMLMGDQRTRAFSDFLVAECRAHPVLLAIDDLQWGDHPSVSALDSALRAVAELPFVLIACARPEVHDLFPKLWSSRSPTMIALPELARKHAGKLVRAVLGEQTPDLRVDALVERAAGNAFFLEELIRAASEGEEQIPTTVLALVQGRLDALSTEARRILRAASVLGLAFWEGGLRALLGGDRRTTAVGAVLNELVERELIERAPTSRFPTEAEWQFRHALLRDGAYAMLTEDDRRLGHGLAGAWLEKAGEHDALVLAIHFELAKDPERTAHWYVRAAEQALGATDLESAIARAERAIEWGADGETRGLARRVQYEAHRWRGENTAAFAAAREATNYLVAGSPAWCEALGALVTAARDDVEVRLEVGRLLADIEISVTKELVVAWARAAPVLLLGSEHVLAARLFERMEEGARTVPLPLEVEARVHVARAFRASFAGDPVGCMQAYAQAAACFDAAGDLRSGCAQRSNLGYAQGELGFDEAAEASLRLSFEQANRLGLRTVVGSSLMNLAPVLMRRGRLDEAVETATRAAEMYAVQADLRMEGTSRTYLAQSLLARGDTDRALREVMRAMDLLTRNPPTYVLALAVRARVHLARAERDEALRWAKQAHDLLQSIGEIEEGDAAVRLTWAEALHAAGRDQDARSVIADARTRVLARAGRMSDETMRQTFLTRVPDSQRTLALAEALGA